MKKYIPYIMMLCLLYITFMPLQTVISDLQKSPENNVKVIHMQGVPVEIRGRGNKEVVDKYLKDIQYCPKALMRHCKRIVLTSNRKDLEKLEWKLNHTKMKSDIMATTVFKTRKVYILTSKYNAYRVHHELYHCMDASHNPYYSNDETFHSLYEKDGAQMYLTDYERKNWRECFVGCMLTMEGQKEGNTDLENYILNIQRQEGLIQ